MKIKLLTTLGFLYAFLLIYASLMPFDFTSDFNIERQTHRFWSYWPFTPSARISGSDVLSNLVLYVPLGWFVAVRCRMSRLSVILSFTISMLVCSTISVCMEFLQFFTLSRISSASDLLLNTISGGAGTIAGIFCGRKIWERGIHWLENRWQTRPVDIATLFLMGMLMADSLVPFIPTILLKQAWRNLKRSNFDVFDGLSLHPWHWWIMTRIIVYAVLTMLLAIWGKQKPGLKEWIRAAFFVGCFAIGLEAMKLMIVSRTINSANVLTSLMGCLAAIVIGCLFAGRIGTLRKLELTITFLVMYVIYLAWTPFNFTYDYARIQKMLPTPVQMLPLYHYAMGAKMNHIRLFLQSVFLQGLLIYLLRIRFGWFKKRFSGIIYAALLSGLFAFFLESGQFFLPSRVPSMTDIYCFSLGGGLGAMIQRHPEPVPANNRF